MKLFKLHEKVINPKITKPMKQRMAGGFSFDIVEEPGTFYRVFPSTWKEIAAIKMLQHRVDKFAPAVGNGNGVIISDSAFRTFNQ